jgi:CRISPR-associated protein Csb3
VNRPEPTIHVAVDPTNPGQFFACCGLLELAHRLWLGAEGWFDFDRGAFCLSPLDQTVVATSERLIAELGRCRLSNLTDDQMRRLEELNEMGKRKRQQTPCLEEEKAALDKLRREAAVQLHEPFGICVDWFLDDYASGSRFKTWAGQQSVVDIATAMHQPLAAGRWADVPPDRWLGHAVPDDSLPFNFDSNLSSQSSPLDMGFSLDPLRGILKTKSRIRPLLELAAFVGLQRFRPSAVPDENKYRFWLWPVPLLPVAAQAAACGAAAPPGARGYEFRLLYRTKYLKSFLPAQPLRGAR